MFHRSLTGGANEQQSYLIQRRSICGVGQILIFADTENCQVWDVGFGMWLYLGSAGWLNTGRHPKVVALLLWSAVMLSYLLRCWPATLEAVSGLLRGL